LGADLPETADVDAVNENKALGKAVQAKEGVTGSALHGEFSLEEGGNRHGSFGGGSIGDDADPVAAGQLFPEVLLR
jgi:hypothetical protein